MSVKAACGCREGWLFADDGTVEGQCVPCRRCATQMRWDLWLASLDRRLVRNGVGPKAALAALRNGSGKIEAPEGSWGPIGLEKAVEGEAIDGAPTILSRSDGGSLLYAKKVHWIAGEPEAGKGWLVLLGARERIEAGEQVVYIDFEDDEVSVVGRLLALGLDKKLILERFHYIRPDEPLGAVVQAQLVAYVATLAPTLVIIDGVTEAMTLQGENPDKNVEIAAWVKRLPRPLADTGAAVAVLDHVTKDKEHRGRWAIGGQHKLAGLSGAAYTLENVKPFARGGEGMARLIVTKDRPGHVRALAAGIRRNQAGELHMTADDEGRVTVLELRPASDPGAFRPTHLMERISKYLEWQPAPLSQTAVMDGVTGNTPAKRQALAVLINEGFVAVDRSGQSLLHRSARRYREDEDKPTDGSDKGAAE